MGLNHSQGRDQSIPWEFGAARLRPGGPVRDFAQRDARTANAKIFNELDFATVLRQHVLCRHVCLLVTAVLWMAI